MLAPVLLLLATAVADYGHYLETENNLITVVRDGARYASLDPANWTAACAGGPQSTGDSTCPAGYDTVEGLMQAEANSLTLPAGGINLENSDCQWSGATLQPPDPYKSCMTIAYCTAIPTPTGPCIPNTTYANTYFGEYSASLGCFLPAGDTTCPASESTPSGGYLITVWVAYGYEPLTPVFNSVFGLQLIKVDFSVVEEQTP